MDVLLMLKLLRIKEENEFAEREEDDVMIGNEVVEDLAIKEVVEMNEVAMETQNNVDQKENPREILHPPDQDVLAEDK